MKKKSLIVVLVVALIFIAIIAFFVIKSLLTDGYAYYGNVWASSPEIALQKAADQDSQTMETLTPQITFNQTVIDNVLLMSFLSEADTLETKVTVTNVSASVGQSNGFEPVSSS